MLIHIYRAPPKHAQHLPTTGVLHKPRTDCRHQVPQNTFYSEHTENTLRTHSVENTQKATNLLPPPGATHVRKSQYISTYIAS